MTGCHPPPEWTEREITDRARSNRAGGKDPDQRKNAKIPKELTRWSWLLLNDQSPKKFD
jgi:hypothetical protein